MNFVVCIPVLNAASRLPQLFEAIKKQTLQPAAILVIDSSSDDTSVKIAKEYGAQVYIISRHEFNHGGTRNLFLQFATADIYLYLTDDALPADENTFSKMIHIFEQYPRVGFVYGRQLPYAHATPFAAHLRLFNYPESSVLKTIEQKKQWGIKTAFCSDSFAAYRAVALKEIGGFPGNVIVAEDIYVAGKMLLNSWQGYYQAEAKVFHSHQYTLLQEFKRYFDRGVFFKEEPWVLQQLGGVSGEGRKYLLSELRFLASKRKIKLYFEWVARNGLKWLGYKLGYYYKVIPKSFVKKMTMHQGYWC